MKIFTLLSFICLTTISIAQGNLSLTIFNNNGQQFFVVMNGIRQNSLPKTNVKIAGMNSGAYEIKLIFADGKTADINKKLWFDTIAGDFQARVVFKGKKGKLQYYGMTGGAAPAGGSDIQYRPNDQSVYSDQQTSATSTGGGTQTTQQGGGTTQTSGGGQTTMSQGGGSSTSSGSVTTPTTTSDPNMNGTGTSTGSVTTSTTVSDPNTGGTGNFGMTSTTTVSDPNMGGTGNFGMTTTVSDPNNPNGTFGVNINVNMSDPNLNGGQGTYTTTTTVNDGQQGTTTSTNGGMTTTTTTSSSSSSTTTTTVTNGGTWSDPTMGGTMTTDDPNKAIHGTQTTSVSGSGTSGYGCTSIMTNTDEVLTKLKSMGFDSDRREYMEKDLKSVCLNADQAYKIVKTLTFDSDRIDMCKFFYDRMTDKVNGKRLLELLSYESDQEDFTEYMSKH